MPKKYENDLQDLTTAELNDRIANLHDVYEALGREGLAEYSAADVRLLFSAKQLELAAISGRLESRMGSELDAMLKDQLETEVRELGMELTARDPLPTPELIAEMATDHERQRKEFAEILWGESKPVERSVDETGKDKDAQEKDEGGLEL